jgi:hypothetical protein
MPEDSMSQKEALYIKPQLVPTDQVKQIPWMQLQNVHTAFNLEILWQCHKGHGIWFFHMSMKSGNSLTVYENMVLRKININRRSNGLFPSPNIIKMIK